MMNEQKMAFEDVYSDIAYHMRFYIYLKRKYTSNGVVQRYISSISYLNEKEMEEIYGSDGEHVKYGLLSNNAIKLLDLNQVSSRFITTFLQEVK